MFLTVIRTRATWDGTLLGGFTCSGGKTPNGQQQCPDKGGRLREKTGSELYSYGLEAIKPRGIEHYHPPYCSPAAVGNSLHLFTWEMVFR